MLKQFTYSFDDLRLETRDLELLLGFQPSEVPDPFPQMIEQAIQEGPCLFDIRAGYRMTESVIFHRDDYLINIENRIFSPGKIVFNQTRKSERMFIYAGTAGPKITERCQALNREGEELYSYVLDVLGSVVAGKAAEKMADDLERELAPEGYSISESFSPGYCDWSVAEQQLLFSFFPAGFLGISLSPSSLMTPVKSVSGIIGAGHGLKREGYQCRMCDDDSCMWGKIRRGQTV
ncbi:MAG TPA: vitamin B12 dependent-methionine synthase activation domain-containing protein [Prolixibacteraceae bacterium]|nr:vitamin B12 dependent-methionine synthase activation domain-containing protein [Prolixibacteraceae bacterium]